MNTSRKNVAQKRLEKASQDRERAEQLPFRDGLPMSHFSSIEKQADEENTGGNPSSPEGCDQMQRRSTCQRRAYQRKASPVTPERGRPAQSPSLLLTSPLMASLRSQADEKRPPPSRGATESPGSLMPVESGLMREGLSALVRDQPAA